jgi:hypothetical protein
MAQKKRRQYGTGVFSDEEGVGNCRRSSDCSRRHEAAGVAGEALGKVSRTEAGRAVGAKLAAAGREVPKRSRVTFGALTRQWEASVLPMYKHSTQKHRRFIVQKYLMPRFGETPLCNVSRQEIQAYVAHLTNDGYAPRSIDHIHDVLSAGSDRVSTC